MTAVADPEVHEPTEITVDPTASMYLALAKAQMNFPPIKKNRTAKVKSKRTGVEFEYSYCTLDEILEATRGPLNEQGLFLRHQIDHQEKYILVDAVLTHLDGGEIRSGALRVPTYEGDMQAIGSGLTYGRRYTATALLGICAEEDDDAHGTPANPFRRDERQQQRTESSAAKEPPPPKKLTTAEHIANQKTAADLGSLLMAWVGKRPVAKNASEWRRIIKEAHERIGASGWPEDQAVAVLAVVKGIQKDLLDEDAKQAFGDEPEKPAAQPAAPAPKTEAPSLERIAGWLDQLESAADLQNALVSIDSSPKLADLRSNPARVIEVLRHAFKLTQDRVAIKDWTEEQGQTIADELTALETKYDLSAQAAAQFTGSDA